MIKIYRDQQGQRYLDLLWYEDLKQHLRYIENLTLACPCQIGEPPVDAVALSTDPLFDQLKIVELPVMNSYLDIISRLSATVVRLWNAVRQAEIVHAAIVGWPIPYGWLLTPMLRFFPSKFFLIIVESAPWRVPAGGQTKLGQRTKSKLFEQINRWCVNNTNLALFTQKEYQDSLLDHNRAPGYVINASWIDEENIISDAVAASAWQAKLTPAVPALNLLFAGRLTATKGILTLLEAMQIVDQHNIPVNLDILGQGELSSQCDVMADRLKNSVRIQTLGMVAYGPEFFHLTRGYHAVVVPSISDEQP